jgi:hypothetical protein
VLRRSVPFAAAFAHTAAAVLRRSVPFAAALAHSADAGGAGGALVATAVGSEPTDREKLEKRSDLQLLIYMYPGTIIVLMSMILDLEMLEYGYQRYELAM